MVFSAREAFAQPQAAPAATPTTQASAAPQSTMAAPARQPTPRTITAYTAPPDSYKKSQDLARIYLRVRLIGFAYSVLVLWYVLRSRGPFTE